MKKLIFVVIVLVVGLLSSCADEKLGESFFDDSERARNEFDLWLLHNYTYPYNIDLKYRMEDIESDRSYTLIPADIDKAKQLAKVIRHLWLEPYDEIIGIDFTRTYIPKIIHFIGSYAYNVNNTRVLGTAEGGLKVTLYGVNHLTIAPESLNDMYFRTMHHEFAHILHQTKLYDPDFAKISDADYIGGNWNSRLTPDANRLGFVSPYAGSSPNEDFVELYSRFITMTETQWTAMLATAASNSSPGADIIAQKMEILTGYMLNSWNIDIYEMRDILQRRVGEVFVMDLSKL